MVPVQGTFLGLEGTTAFQNGPVASAVPTAPLLMARCEMQNDITVAAPRSMLGKSFDSGLAAPLHKWVVRWGGTCQSKYFLFVFRRGVV